MSDKTSGNSPSGSGPEQQMRLFGSPALARRPSREAAAIKKAKAKTETPETEGTAIPMPAINEFTEGMQVEGFYALRECNLRESRTGSHFIRLTIGDATGSISGNIWDATEELYQSLSKSDVVKVRGVVEMYKNQPQIKVVSIRPAQASEAPAGSLMPETPKNRDELVRELQMLIMSIEDADYQKLLTTIFSDTAFIERFRSAPAAKEFHHAYIGGLLEHSVSMARICDMYARMTPTLRRGLLIAGALLHDMGKLEEMQARVSVEYTDEGSLIGHLVQGVLMLEDMLRDKLPDFPRDKRALLMHLILSHHGKREYGSPVLPAIPEAFALHHIDNLDAKVFAALRQIENDPDAGRNWTERSFMLETRLFKG